MDKMIAKLETSIENGAEVIVVGGGIAGVAAAVAAARSGADVLLLEMCIRDSVWTSLPSWSRAVTCRWAPSAVRKSCISGHRTKSVSYTHLSIVS